MSNTPDKAGLEIQISITYCEGVCSQLNNFRHAHIHCLVAGCDLRLGTIPIPSRSFGLWFVGIIGTFILEISREMKGFNSLSPSDITAALKAAVAGAELPEVSEWDDVARKRLDEEELSELALRIDRKHDNYNHSIEEGDYSIVRDACRCCTDSTLVLFESDKFEGDKVVYEMSDIESKADGIIFMRIVEYVWPTIPKEIFTALWARLAELFPEETVVIN